MIPPMIHTNVYLIGALIRRISGRASERAHKTVLFRKYWAEKNSHCFSSLNAILLTIEASVQSQVIPYLICD
jgi:hypothetical protein